RVSVDASAKNTQAACKAKEQHDKSCPWGGTGTEVRLIWCDIEGVACEEGDVICGLVVVGDETVATGMMRVTCDAEGDGGGRSEEEEVETVEAVAARGRRSASPSRRSRPSASCSRWARAAARTTTDTASALIPSSLL